MNAPQTPADIAYEAWVRSKEFPPIPPTPGQIAYEAYWRSARYGRVPVAWAKLLPQWRAGWEAAAQAVAARAVADTLEVQRILAAAALQKEGDALTHTQALDHLAAILSRLRHLRDAFHDPLNRADITEAQACLEDVALRLQEDIAQMDTGLEETP